MYMYILSNLEYDCLPWKVCTWLLDSWLVGHIECVLKLLVLKPLPSSKHSKPFVLSRVSTELQSFLSLPAREGWDRTHCSVVFPPQIN